MENCATHNTERQGNPDNEAPRLSYTTLFISNLHCPSCVKRIEQTLNSHTPKPESISISIVSHYVVIHHDRSLPVTAITEALEAEGFEIHSVFQQDYSDGALGTLTEQHGTEWADDFDRAIKRWRQSWRHSILSKKQTTHQDRDACALPERPDMGKQRTHAEKCPECRVEAAVYLKDDGIVEVAKVPSSLPERASMSLHSVETDNQKTKNTSEGGAIELKDLVEVEAAPMPITYQTELSITGMTCSSCVATITELVEKLHFVQSVNVSLLTNSASITFDGKENLNAVAQTIEDAGFDVSVAQLEELKPKIKAPQSTNDLWKAAYAIEGMTCSACVGNISSALQKLPFIEKADVNLISNSATVVFHENANVDRIKQTIEDAGYDVTLDGLEHLGVAKDEAVIRDVSILVSGMYCHHCPTKIVTGLLETYGDSVAVEEAPTLKHPILRIRYTAKPPDLTIRDILLTLSSLDPALVPSIHHPPTIEERSRAMHARERRRILLRLGLCVTAAIPTFVVGIVFMSLLPSGSSLRNFAMHPVGPGSVSVTQWLLFTFATPVYFLAADTFHRRAIKEVRAMWRRGSPTPLWQRFVRFGSMNMLISLGTSIAYFASIAELAIAATQPKSMEMAESSTNASYFDSVVFLTMFLLIGRFIEAYSKAKTGDAVTSLGKLRPTEAILFSEKDTEGRRLSVDLLEVGDVVLIPHGSSPPFDGIIVDGDSQFDESSLTGESKLVKKNFGDQAFSGTVNKGGPVSLRLTGVSGTSMLDQIIKIVREGQTKRAPVERAADVITSHFVPFVILVAIVTWTAWLILGETKTIPEDWRENQPGGWPLWSFRFAIAVFVIACPCGIGLAAPTALFVGGGLAARNGILVKGGGEAFQEASTLDCIVFDKTGTLTQGGQPTVTDYKRLTSDEEEEVLGMAKRLEQSSGHPIAKAIVDFCGQQSTKSYQALDVQEIPGKGLSGRFKLGEESQSPINMDVIIGNEKFMSDHDVNIDVPSRSLLQHWERQGKSVVLIAIRASNPFADPTQTAWVLSALFAISDALRLEASETVVALQNRGINVWMLSGDNPTTAQAVGEMVGIPKSNVIAGVLPDQKAEKIQWLQKSLPKRNNKPHAMVAMAGDGINDSPALTMADVGIAIGSGSDVAISSAEFILISSDLKAVLTLIDLSRKVFRRVWFNFGWALIYNLIAMPVAAGVLYPIVAKGEHVALNPVWASLAMALSSVSVICSSLVLRSRIPVVGFRPKKA